METFILYLVQMYIDEDGSYPPTMRAQHHRQLEKQPTFVNRTIRIFL